MPAAQILDDIFHRFTTMIEGSTPVVSVHSPA